MKANTRCRTITSNKELEPLPWDTRKTWTEKLQNFGEQIKWSETKIFKLRKTTNYSSKTDKINFTRNVPVTITCKELETQKEIKPKEKKVKQIRKSAVEVNDSIKILLFEIDGTRYNWLIRGGAILLYTKKY